MFKIELPSKKLNLKKTELLQRFVEVKRNVRLKSKVKRIVRVKSKPKRIVRVKSKDQKIRGKAALSFFEEKFPNFGVDRFGIKWPILVHKK